METLKPEPGAVDRLDELIEDLGLPANDSRIIAFNGALARELDQNEAFRQDIEGVLEARQDLLPSQASNLILRGFQKQLLRDAPLTGYPKPFVDVETWRRGMMPILQDPESRAELLYDLHNRDAQSNITERYKAFALIVFLMRGTFDKRPNILDIGSSRNHGLKKMGLLPQVKGYPFGGTAVITPGGRRDTRRGRMINTWLEFTYGIGPSVGLDIEDPADVQSQEWAKACSFYPSELLDDSRVEEYDLLDELSSPHITTRQADFADPNLLDNHDLYRSNSYDMVTYSSVLDWASPAERQTMLANGRRLLKPHGLVVVQDFARLDYHDPTNLQFYKNWHKKPYRYRTLVSSNREGDEFHEIFRWNDGRCAKVKLQPALGRLALTERSGLL